MVYLVYGSPCSGKTTYVREHAKRGDIISDLDAIYGAITSDDEHDADLYTIKVAKELDAVLREIIRERRGKWKNAYVTSIANTKEKLKADMEIVNADECIYIDTPLEVCMERAKDRPYYFQWIIQKWHEEKDFG